ncbi:putative quinol monooxygenase [Bacillus salipaludis]|uniref:putative quinol monooxygenase n=1 Tax=Bacillus salipaludis TaxID=2547811 RepID=UPI002E220B42|nr:putative quinol monooxygenase [Bacillus salipaludis]
MNPQNLKPLVCPYFYNLLKAGCIKYDWHQSEDQTFVLYEVWKDEEALEHHIQSAHYQEYRNNIADLVSTREVYKLKIME